MIVSSDSTKATQRIFSQSIIEQMILDYIIRRDYFSKAVQCKICGDFITLGSPYPNDKAHFREKHSNILEKKVKEYAEHFDNIKSEAK